MRLSLAIIALASAMLASFALWGPWIDRAVGSEAALEWFRAHGVAGALAIVGLLIVDVILPIPTTPLLTLLGSLYGPIVGGLLGALGSTLAGAAAYGLTRLGGERMARAALGGRDHERLAGFFAKRGGWTVALSRWLPMLPEIVAFLAGMAAMPPGRFLVALICGSVPMAFAFAALGAGLADRPILATVLAAVLPALLWPLARHLTGARRDARSGSA
ncbi:MAG TPA: VTT domain-containing protein [Phycisphaerales bacterium]|nr:VTT domain-containing protein [Phycisphaerales bacterium]HMP38479.1 VTT domain-containing protein [Phycisphaerales bacterium]